MATRLISFCSSTGKNTGGIDCDIQLQNPKFMMIGSAKFLPSEYASEAALKAAIKDRINRPNGDAEKLYPFVTINGVDKSTEADTVETAADGTKRTLKTSPESYSFHQWGVGLNQEAALVAFNGTTIPSFIFDDTWKMIGKYDSDKNLIGNKVQINTKGAGLSTYAAGPDTVTTINFVDPLALSGNARVYEFTSFDSSDFEGLLDVEVYVTIAPTGNAHKVGVRFDNKSISKGATNFYDEYSAELADVDMWRGWTAAGVEVAPTTVVVDATNKGWTVTFGVAVAKIDLAPADELYAADVIGIEGVALAVA